MDQDMVAGGGNPTRPSLGSLKTQGGGEPLRGFPAATASTPIVNR